MKALSGRRTDSLRTSLACIALTVLLGACAHATARRTPVGEAVAAKPKDCQIEVISILPAGKGYREICLIEARSEGILRDSTLQDKLSVMKEQACLCGADALLVRSYSPGAGLEWHPGGALATAIRWVP